MTTAMQPMSANDPVVQMLKSWGPRIERVCAAGLDPKRFVGMFFEYGRVNPEVFKCTPQSLFEALCKSAATGLTIGGGLDEAHILPFRNRGQLEATFIKGYRGEIKLAMQSDPRLVSIKAKCVSEGDEFEYEEGLHPKLRHVPNGESGDLKFVYAIARYRDADPEFTVLTKAQVEKRKNASRGSDSNYSPWKQWEAEMWEKTAIKSLVRTMPKTSQAAWANHFEDDEDFMPLPLRQEVVDEFGEIRGSSSTDDLKAKLAAEAPKKTTRKKAKKKAPKAPEKPVTEPQEVESLSLMEEAENAIEPIPELDAVFQEAKTENIEGEKDRLRKIWESHHKTASDEKKMDLIDRYQEVCSENGWLKVDDIDTLEGLKTFEIAVFGESLIK